MGPEEILFCLERVETTARTYRECELLYQREGIKFMTAPPEEDPEALADQLMVAEVNRNKARDVLDHALAAYAVAVSKRNQTNPQA